MIVFISGGAKSGKSHFAQDLAVKLSKGGRHYYAATLIPVDEEDRQRIRNHLADRDGLGFETIECGKNILTCLEYDTEGAFLLDSVTALLQNVMFPPETNYEMDLRAAQMCAEDVERFAKSVANAVIVSDYIYSDAEHYSRSTEEYRRCLAHIDRKLAAISDTVIEFSAGFPIVYKGRLPE